MVIVITPTIITDFTEAEMPALEEFAEDFSQEQSQEKVQEKPQNKSQKNKT